jgi:hypothetical protein
MRLRVVAGLVLVALVLPLGAGARRETATWQRIPFPPGWAGTHALKVLGWESGRVWVDFDDQGGFRIVSAKVVSGRLGSFVTTPVANPARDPWLNGNALIWGLGSGQASMTAPLLANGHLGPATPLPGDPEGVVAQAIGPTGTAVVLAAVNVGSRRVWAVNGGPDGKSLASLMVCCSAAGTPTNLTSMLLSRQAGIFPYTTALGRDGHGRLWIAWGDTKRNYSIYPQLTAHLVQLDPTTLAVIHSSTYASVLPPTPLLCSDACRLVSGGGGASVWGGSGSPVRAAASGQLLAAGGTSKLSLVTLDEKIKGQPDEGGFRVVLHRGPATGAGERVVTAVDRPKAYTVGASDSVYPLVPPAVGVTPLGAVVVLQQYGDYRNRTRVYSIVLR